METRRNSMFRKTIVLLAVFLVLGANHAIFSQAVTLDTALANAAREIADSVPRGAKIAVLNISSDYRALSDYIINELIVNLVNTRAFQVVPRSEVELGAARREFGFQMTGDVSDESQKNLGQFLGADTIISGSVTRDYANSYRIVINTINLESFTYQASYRASIQNNNQVRTLVASSGAALEDFSSEERLKASALNLLFGAGSFAIQKDTKGGTVTAILEGVGIVVMVAGGIMYESEVSLARSSQSSGGYYYGPNSILDSYNAYPFFGGLGLYIGGAVYGIIRAQMYQKPGLQAAISANNPINNISIVPVYNGSGPGMTVLYSASF
jgi:TolB-like protein